MTARRRVTARVYIGSAAASGGALRLRFLVVASILFDDSPAPAQDEGVLQVGRLFFALIGTPALLPASRDKAPHAAPRPALAFPVVVLALLPAVPF